jgi:hypothetical protein
MVRSIHRRLVMPRRRCAAIRPVIQGGRRCKGVLCRLWIPALPFGRSLDLKANERRRAAYCYSCVSKFTAPFFWIVFFKSQNPVRRRVSNRQSRIGDSRGETYTAILQSIGASLTAKVFVQRSVWVFRGSLLELLFGVQLFDGRTYGETPH